ncbi:MAG: hypothetical protein ACREAA_20330 [Candidatus Polarisedimenticolia bacterium]
MSLKAFHIVFVTLATLLAFAFAAWAFSAGMPLAGGLAAVFGAGLIVYGFWFWKKIKPLTEDRGERPRIGRPRVVVPLALASLAWLLSGRDATACSVCYGAAEGQMIEAARAGVWLMIGFVAVMQVGFGLFFIQLWRRARKHKESAES